MSNKVMISRTTIVDLDAVTFATLEEVEGDGQEEFLTVNYALAGDPNKFSAHGKAARVLWDGLMDDSESNWTYMKYIKD